MANFCCSIELEPRTLNQVQLDQAREVAVGIINKEPNEASNIFVEGLKPVDAIKKMATVMVVQETSKQLEKGGEEEDYYSMDNNKTNIGSINGTPAPCQCSCNSSYSPLVDSPDAYKFKEPLSAPF